MTFRESVQLGLVYWPLYSRFERSEKQDQIRSQNNFNTVLDDFPAKTHAGEAILTRPALLLQASHSPPACRCSPAESKSQGIYGFEHISEVFPCFSYIRDSPWNSPHPCYIAPQLGPQQAGQTYFPCVFSSYATATVMMSPASGKLFDDEGKKYYSLQAYSLAARLRMCMYPAGNGCPAGAILGCGSEHDGSGDTQ